MSDEASVDLLDQFVSRARQLYSLPTVALEVLRLTEHDEVDARALKDCIERDPALTGKLLRVVNSSLFGVTGQVNDLNQAIALLGTKPLKVLVLGFSLPPDLFRGLEGDVLQEYWRHTLVKATAARVFSRRVWGQPGDEAFLAGLLQDIGVLVLIQHVGEPFLNFLDRVRREQVRLTAAELGTLGFHHTELSAQLLEAWGLPAALPTAIRQPADADRLLALPAAEQELPQLLHLSELTATLLDHRDPAILDELLAVGSRYQGLSREQLQEVVDELMRQVPQLASVLSIRFPEAEYEEILRDAQARLNEAAEDLIYETLDQSVGSLEPESQQLQAAIRQLAQLEPAHLAVPADPSHANAAAGAEVGLPGSTATLVRHDPALMGRLTAAVTACRQSRRPLSLLLVELDDHAHLVFSQGTVGAASVVDELLVAIDDLEQRPLIPLEVHEGCVAVLLPGCDREPALEIGRHLVGDVPDRLARRLGQPDLVIPLSVGLATLTLAPKNYRVEQLIDAAERCLYAAQDVGGVVKSIVV